MSLFAQLLVFIAVPTVAQNPQRDKYTKYEYMIPMRDGTKLYTNVYVPKDKPGKHPILLQRTPYGAGPYGPDTSRFHSGSKLFQDAGYAFAYQDVRGRGRSEGTFTNLRPQLIVHLRPADIDESTDAWDTIDYLVKNVPENNGRVGIWGISYPGGYAALGAIDSHPALKAASPQAPTSDWFVGDDFHHQGALFLMDAVGFARFGESREVSSRSTMPGINTQGDPYNFYLNAGGLGNITNTYFKDTDGLWHDLVEHPNYDEYWQARRVPDAMKNVKCAVLTVGGFFDAEDCWGPLHVFAGIQKMNPKTVNGLVMGPWFHGMWAGRESTGGTKFGDQTFGMPTATYFQDKIEFPFFDAYLRGNGMKLPKAQVFETGVNQWKTFSTWPPQGLKETAFYLNPGRSLSTQLPSGGSDHDEYVSDPANPVPYQGGKITSRTREYMIDDQRFASTRPDVLVYQTEPLTSDLSIAGPIKNDLFITTTGTDADFVVKVIDVFPPEAEGKLANYQMLLRGEIHRARYRHSYQSPRPLTPGEVEEIAYEMPDVFHTFKKGHRIMVQVQSSWFPLVDRNPQKFINIYHARSEDFQKATIQLHHSPNHPSHITVGVLRR